MGTTKSVGSGTTTASSATGQSEGGGGGAADCSGLADGTVCPGGTCCAGDCRTDYADDPENCGTCGRVCGSGDCQGVACAGEEVDTAQEEIASLETDDIDVYWASAGGTSPTVGGVKRVSLSSGIVQDVLPNTYLYNGAIPRGTTLFVTDYEEQQNGGGVYTCPKDNCEGNLMPIGTFTWPYACPHLWVTSDLVIGCAWTGTNVVPFRCSLQGCDTWSGADPSKLSVTTDGTRAYWSSFTSGTIVARHLTSGTETTFASGLDSPWLVAAGDDSNLYWYEEGRIRRATLGPQQANTADVIGVLGVRDLRERDGTLYWLTGDGAVSACDPDDCAGTVQAIAFSPASTSANTVMIVTPAEVYFTENSPGSHRLLRVPR